MRVWLLVVLLAGCIGAVPDEPDLTAPRPGPYSVERATDPAGTPVLAGIVRGIGGHPIAGADVWLESTDIRLPVNNLDDYLHDRRDTIVATTADGRFTLPIEGAVFHVVIEAPGYLVHRSPYPQSDRLDVQLIPETLRIVAHRGASFYAPENTQASLAKARWLGASIVEVDVRMDADGRLIVIHDDTVDRTTDGEGWVHQLPTAAFQHLDAGHWYDASFKGQRIPVLRDHLAQARALGIHVMLDVKSPPDARADTWRAVLREVATIGAQDIVTFSTFWERGVRECRAWSDMECGWLRQNTTEPVAWLDRASAASVDWVQVHPDLLSHEFMDRARELDLQVMVWTLNTPEEWSAVLAYDVDAVVTDRMGYLLDHLHGYPVPFGAQAIGSSGTASAAA